MARVRPLEDSMLFSLSINLLFSSVISFDSNCIVINSVFVNGIRIYSSTVLIFHIIPVGL